MMMQVEQRRVQMLLTDEAAKEARVLNARDNFRCDLVVPNHGVAWLRGSCEFAACTVLCPHALPCS